MEVLELAATLGIHAMNIGVPILVEVLEEEGLRSGLAPLNARQQEIGEGPAGRLRGLRRGGADRRGQP
jgi:hypothetical protein